jgi:hypothetical protein
MWLITYWWIAVTMDWASTISAHDYRVEETPLMRYVWQRFGDTGFTVTTLLFGIVYTLIIYYGLKYKFKWAVIPTSIVMITFKILIALTNLTVIPYWVTGWY